ncbi:hypothetical protein GCM10028799_31970 [Kribbella italica]
MVAVPIRETGRPAAAYATTHDPSSRRLSFANRNDLAQLIANSNILRLAPSLASRNRDRRDTDRPAGSGPARPGGYWPSSDL